jgi:hypothetical protein
MSQYGGGILLFRQESIAMRKSGGLLIPLTMIVLYYGVLIGAMVYLLNRFPVIAEFFPIGGVDELAGSGETFEAIFSGADNRVFSANGPLRLLVASMGAIVLTVPVSWTYFITSRARSIDQSFLQTIMILPVVVTGISMVVLNSLPLAFALAGVVAAVRFRFTLRQPSDAMYIFVAIAIGLGSGIGALGIATVISFAFVISTLVIWKLEYGKTLSGPFLTMITRRDAGEEDYD